MSTNTEPRVLLTYRYRDASNFKVNGEILLSGQVTGELLGRLRSSLLDHEYFIPELVGLPPLREKLYQYSDGEPTDDDHLLHEFVELRAATFAEIASIPGSGELQALVARFESTARRGWWAGVGELMDRLDLPD